MDKALLAKTAAAMVAPGKGVLAADESSGTCETRFKTVNVECTEENRRAYRGLLFTTPGVEKHVSGVILFARNVGTSDETRKLIRELKAIAPGPLLLSVDQEGGRVARMKPPVNSLVMLILNWPPRLSTQIFTISTLLACNSSTDLRPSASLLIQ